MKRSRFFLLFLFLLSGGAEPATASKPNMVLILADDLGWSDTGCYGGEIQTPHIDALARGGLRFTRFYNTARCCPTRASLLTGLYPHQAGVGAMSNDRGPSHPGYRGTLQPHCVTLAEVLRTAGYRTCMAGKWHLYNNAGVKPTDRGFDEFYGMLDGYNSCWEEDPYYTRWPQDRPRRVYTSAAGGKPGTFYATDVFADYALDFMAGARTAQRPFFLYLAFNAPHFPLHAYERDIAKYEALYFEKGWDVIREERLARQKQLGLVPAGLALPPRSTVPAKSHARPSAFAGRDNPAWLSLPEERRRDLARRMAVYAAMVDRMDAAIGRVTDDLKAHGELENTLILFLSDNGACWEWDPYGFDVSSSPQNILHRGDGLKRLGQPGDYMSYGSGWANAGNTPWRLYKHFSHEGGIRSPFIVHWPAVIRTPGELRTQAGHVIDLMPTLAAAAGAVYPSVREGVPVKPAEGCSLLPALRNEPLARPAPFFFEHEGSRAVHDGKWKLVSMKDDAWELYDMEADPAEMNDVIRDQPEKARALKSQWHDWAARCGVEVFSEEPAGGREKAPDIAGKAFTAACEVTDASGDGVVAAQGGRQFGWALHLKEGKPVFAVRIAGSLTEIKSPAAVAGRFRLRASLARDGAMSLQVDGEEVAAGRAPGPISQQPQDGLTTGEDTLSTVGDYTPPHALKGVVSRLVITTP